jgi:hypothetical protein
MTNKPTTEDWLSPMNKLIWIKAFKAKATTVTLRDGRKFRAWYTQRDNVPIVEVHPMEGRVPMGYFELKKVTDHSWLSDGNGHKK